MDVLEIDPEVTQVAIERLGLRPGDTIRTLNLDARLAIENMPADQVYDVIVGDAFNGYGVPYHLTTKEFNDRVRQHLAPGGIYMLNIIDGRRGEFARSEARTLRATFPYVAAMPVNEEYSNQWGNLWVMLGSDRPINRPAYLDATQTAPRPDLTSHLWDGEKLDQFLATGYSVLLTDDYVPVDNLLAPVFEEAGF
jgi:spermidine synthase